MNSIAIRLIVLVCVFGGALFGMFLRGVLPEQHLSADSKDTVRLGIGLIGTMTALILGLLVASAKSFYDTQSSELTEMSAKIVLLDRVLAHYGPETKEVRDLLHGAVDVERSDGQKGLVIFDGKDMTIYTAYHNIYATTSSQGTLDQAI